MPRFAAFLRAVNVGGHGVVTMGALKKIFESSGLSDVESFIASGNLVFAAKAVKGLDVKIAAALEKALGHQVATFVRSIDEVVAAAAFAPFPDRDAAVWPTYVVGFLSKDLDAAGAKRLSLLSTKEDRFHVRGRDFWWLSKHHQARPAITGRQLEKALGEPTTLRNVNTIRRMAEKYGDGKRLSASRGT
jgi:uncharacterized protein (DUF1697 family)